MFVSGQSEVEPTGRVLITNVVLIIVVKTPRAFLRSSSVSQHV